jgi:hypothetical protein
MAASRLEALAAATSLDTLRDPPSDRLTADEVTYD